MPSPHGNDPSELTRREFLTRAAKAGLAVAAAGTVGYAVYDAQGPSGEAGHAQVRLGSYALQNDRGPRMAIVTGGDRVQTVRAALKGLGGIERFVARGDRVLLKVNAAFATPAVLSATSHPDLVAEVARLCLAAGAAAVIVTDNSINDPQSCFAISGIADAARAAGARVVLPQESFFRPSTVPNARIVRNWPILYKPFEGVTKVIGISPVKHHERSGASMSMKNWYGLTGGRRNKFHQDIHNSIAELAQLLTPTLVILDGTVSMMKNGPTGGSLDDLKNTHTMIVSTDMVAADAFGASLLGLTAAELPYIGKGEKAGLGVADYRSLNPVTLTVEDGQSVQP